jgi:plasmid maintenance system antidote protein VapI
MIDNKATIKELMKDRDIKLKEMAIELECSKQHVSYMVNGKRKISLERASVFANKLGITLDDFYKAIKNGEEKTNEV